MANIKFSAFTTETNSADVDFLVGYQGTTMKKIAPSNLGGSYPFQIETDSLYSGFVPSGLSGAPQGNTVLGIDAGNALTVGINNTIIGNDAGKVITNGGNNVFIGFEAALASSTNTSDMVVIGQKAFESGSGGSGSILIGKQAGNSQTGELVVGIGREAARVNTSDYHISIGYEAGYSNTSGANNTNIGYQAGKNNTTSQDRTMVGNEAGAFQTGSQNTGIGRYALRQGTGLQNVAVGTSAMVGNMSGGSFNTVVGYNAMSSNGNKSNNVIVGRDAARLVTTGSTNTILGSLAGDNLTTGSNNILIGYDATASAVGVSNEITLGDANITALRIPGLQSGASDGDVLTFSSGTGLITLQAGGGGGGSYPFQIDTESLYSGFVPGSLSGTPQGNTTLGIDAGKTLTTGSSNTLIGHDAGKSITTAVNNTIVGYNSGITINGTGNTVLGMEAGTGLATVGAVNIGWLAGSTGNYSITLGAQVARFAASQHSVFIGEQAGYAATSGDGAIGIGNDALRSNTSTGNVAIGRDASYSNSSGAGNTSVGFEAAYATTSGGNNTAIGYQTMSQSVGSKNTFLGYHAGIGYNSGTSTASDNIAIGYQAMAQRRGGSGGNTVIGNDAYKNTDGGTGNIVIGKDAVPTAGNGSNNVVIGTGADLAATTDNNSIIIGNAGVGLGTNTTVLGNSSTTTTVIKGNVGLLDATTPGSALDILSATNGTDSVQLRLRTTAVSANTLQKVVGFYQASTSERGYIAINQYSVQYNTSSDYRLKENIVEINDGISRLKSLKPCRFNFISPVDENGNKLDPNPKTLDGFIAHEAQAVIPECVGGDKDAVDKDGKPVYQGIDQSKIVPLLTAALKEAVTKIEQLETRIQTLENN